MKLADKHCVPCRGGVPPLKGEELDRMKTQMPAWQVVDEHHLARSLHVSRISGRRWIS